AAIAEIADQPPHALLQRQYGLRQLQLVERIAAGAANGLGTRLHERIARHRKRQLVDHDEAQRRPADVDALPKAARAEQYRVAVGTEAVQELAARAAALHEHRPRRAVPLDPFVGALQRSIAREEQKRAATHGFEQRPNDLKQPIDVQLIARI